MLGLEKHQGTHQRLLFLSNDDSLDNLGIVEDIIPNLVYSAKNSTLVAIPSDLKICTTIFSLDPNSSLGPHGFGGIFYQHSWEIIGDDVCLADKESFHSGRILENLISNFLVLIPKVEEAHTIGNFRPIVLSNFLFKIITKFLLTDCL